MSPFLVFCAPVNDAESGSLLGPDLLLFGSLPDIVTTIPIQIRNDHGRFYIFPEGSVFQMISRLRKP